MRRPLEDPSYSAMRVLLSALLLAATPLPGAAAPPSQPVVVELFTSQGCSSCPPADAAVAAVADRPDVIALSFNVAYWDHLGWKDTFARPEFTDRQVAYARALAQGAPYTPEVVAGGRVGGVGASRPALDGLIARGRAQPLTRISADAGHVRVAAGVAPRRGAEVWLVRYDPREVQVPVKAGENNGKTLPQRNVVRRLIRLGAWTGAAADYVRPAPDAGLADVVLVQVRDGGPILGAGRL